MGYKNTSSLAYEVESALSGYSVLSHGDIGAFYNSVTNAQMPGYTAMFYSQNDKEAMADLKYDRVELGYDKHLRDVKESVRGPPIELYVPRSVIVPDGIGRSAEVEVLPKKTVADEISKAQDEVSGKKMIVKISDFEEEIHIRRRIRRVEITKIDQDLLSSPNSHAKRRDISDSQFSWPIFGINESGEMSSRYPPADARGIKLDSSIIKKKEGRLSSDEKER